MYFYKNKKVFLIILIITLLIITIFKLSLETSDLKKESVSIVYIERETINVLNSFKTPLIEDVNSSDFKSNLLKNTVEVKEFSTLISLLVNGEDGSTMWEMNELISKYYLFLVELNNKINNNDNLSLEDYNEYKKIYTSLNILNDTIYDSFNSTENSNHLSNIYTNIKNQLYNK